MTHLTVQQLSASLDGALTGPSLELVVRHLAACHECRDRQARLAKHDDALRRLLGQDPDDLFLDDLTRRAEAQVIAISKGTPPPAMSTSVPLIHEEDPYAPVEPPAPPPRPELGRAGEIAKEAGWGRIGLKPTANTRAPESNPEEAQRLLEALESGNMDDFTELTAQGTQEHASVDGPTFELPAWIKEQSKPPGKKDGPREVQKMNLFFAEFDERAAGLTREAMDEVFRRDEGAPDSPEVPAQRPTLSLVPQSDALPPGHAAYAPPGYVPPAPGEPAASMPWEHGVHDSGALHADDDDTGDAGDRDEHTPAFPGDANTPGSMPGHAAPLAHAAPAATGYLRVPEALKPAHPANTIEPFVLKPTRPRTAPKALDSATILAIVSVAGLLLILIALHLAPLESRPRKRGDGVLGAQVPVITLVRKDTPAEPPAVPAPHVSAAASTPVDEPVPPIAEPVADTDANPHADGAASRPQFEIPPVIEPDTATGEPAKPVTRAGVRPAAKPARAAQAAARTDKPAASAAVPSDDTDWPLLCGVVVDANGMPVAGARVTVTEIAFSMRTDARGHFCLSAPAGTQHLLVEAAGFTAARQGVTLTANNTELRLQLQPAR
ncbi:MAG: carboxypeptidase regulatory-like domain-containing protein [Candidatus Eisenbacteria bacterium]